MIEEVYLARYFTPWKYNFLIFLGGEGGFKQIYLGERYTNGGWGAQNYIFLAALTSSRSKIVGWSVGRLVGQSVRLCVRDLCEKVTFRISNGN